jgi:seryl-tRNA synthetase
MSFEQQIQQWVQIDNQLKIFNEKLKELRDKKNSISQQINNHIEENQLSNASIKINDGQLKFVKIKETQPLTFKYLETCLSEIIKNEEQVKKIVEYIKNKREVKYIPEIKRFYNN